LKISLTIVVAGTAIAVYLLRASIEDSESWVRLHSDIRWHRKWQDARKEKHIDRVRDIYGRLAIAHPDNPDYIFLKIRSHQTGRESLALYRKALEKHPNHPWLNIGLAHNLESVGEADEGLQQRLKAVDYFGDDVPADVLASAISSCRNRRDWDALLSLYHRHSGAINASKETAISMASAEFVRGNATGSIRWEDRAVSLGYQGQRLYRDSVSYMKAVGISSDILGQKGSGYPHSVEIRDLGMSSDGKTITFYVQYGNAREENPNGYFFITTKDGRWVSASISSDWPSLEHVARAVFTLEPRDQVDNFVLGSSSTGSWRNALVTVPIGVNEVGVYRETPGIMPE
jgi:hypothetical protein